LKILLDNCVHVLAVELFPGHAVVHARQLGWRELSNGALIAAAADQHFDVLATTDKKMRFEHNLERLPISIFELAPRFTRIADLRSLAQSINEALEAARTHRFVSVHADRTVEQLAPFIA
jgi:hypothetical protein